MKQEIREIPDILENLISHSENGIKTAAENIGAHHVPYVTTIARGSSDHAATYLKYIIELYAGVPVASIGPSISSIYGAKLDMSGALSLSISQSGQSPDIVHMTEMARKGNARTIAITNDVTSPLANVCDHALDIKASNERSVAATKTFVSSVVTGLLFVAYWKNNRELLEAIKKLPEQVNDVFQTNWDILLDGLNGHSSIYCLGRGPAWAIANEAALKFKETCQIHAESYSSAEVMHGPKSIIGQEFPVIAFAARDASEKSMIQSVQMLGEQGGQCYITSEKVCSAEKLAFVSSGHPATDPLLLIISFYQFIEKLARHRGLNPDEPPHLKKVTETI
ncbi:SIS domain-containing protein [Pseudemcibacter aquimaris]|uniref:SIS domain-containing protein n=1 Tax=Pseudemcibacter aquimaris TaxID=2857064 RepID=UPI00202B7D46|nr:SIS domain-containing protein [Pseudemcibacter aquimaris]MCC3860208.1 SIS domain-containing protein [Pseudemcibacter aquimaris]